jgi:hypothetical protein
MRVRRKGRARLEQREGHHENSSADNDARQRGAESESRRNADDSREDNRYLPQRAHTGVQEGAALNSVEERREGRRLHGCDRHKRLLRG